jgi:hypothetical protein
LFSQLLYIHYEGAKKAIEKMGLEKERQFFHFIFFKIFQGATSTKQKINFNGQQM